MNYLWAGMLLIGILYGGMTGRMGEVTQAAISSSKEAVSLCIAISGVIAMWSGVMEIAKGAGLIEQMTRRMGKVLDFLFPEIPRQHPVREFIATNMIANVIGLSWAATPSGLKAMEYLDVLNNRKETASRSMCTFLIINISSLQLIPINMIAYRSQYGSANPTAIVGPAIAATCISTLAGILYCKWKQRKP